MKNGKVMMVFTVFALAAMCLFAPTAANAADPAFAGYFLAPFKACVGGVPIEFVFTSAGVIPDPTDATLKVAIADVAGYGFFGTAKRPIGVNGTAMVVGNYVRFNLVVPSAVSQTVQMPAVWEFQVKNAAPKDPDIGIASTSGVWQWIGANAASGKLIVGCELPPEPVMGR